MRLSTFLLGGVAAIGVSSAALAADLVVYEPEAAPVVALSTTDWSGFYAGVHGGYGTGVLNLDPEIALDIDADDVEEDVAGWLIGGQIGYNFQADSLLFGIQSDIAWSGIAYDEDGDGENDTIDWLGSTTGRVGFVADSFVPYLKGGIAYAGGTGHLGDEEDSQVHVGWTVGAGVEFALADNVTLFGEYNYYDLGAATYEFTPGTVDVDAQLHTIKAGINFGF